MNIKITEFQSRMYRNETLRSIEKYRDQPILIFGAGAIGSGVIVRLVSQGYKNLVIIDFDSIELSNYSRAEFLYDPLEDMGKPKAAAAALRSVAQMVDGGKATGINIDAMDIGARFIEQFPIVICCLDSVAGRIHVNSECRKAGRPLIETGTYDLNAQAQFFDPEGPCYACYNQGRSSEFDHHSCTHGFRKAVEQGLIPATPIASTMASLLAANLMMNYFCEIGDVKNNSLFYDGRNYVFLKTKLEPVKGCGICQNKNIDHLIPLRISSEVKLGEALEIFEKEIKNKVSLIAQFDLIVQAQCPICARWQKLNRPIHKIYEDRRICPECKDSGSKWNIENPGVEIINSYEHSSRIDHLEMSLYELGYPRGAIITAMKNDQSFVEFGLDGDPDLLMKLGSTFRSKPLRSIL